MEPLNYDEILPGGPIKAEHVRRLYRLLKDESVNQASALSGGQAFFDHFMASKAYLLCRMMGIRPSARVLLPDGYSLVGLPSGENELRVLIDKPSEGVGEIAIGENGEAVVLVQDPDGFLNPFVHPMVEEEKVSNLIGTPIKIGPNYEDCVRFTKAMYLNMPEYATVIGANADPLYAEDFNPYWEKAYDGINPIVGWNRDWGYNAYGEGDNDDTDYMVILGIRYQLDYDANHHALYIKYAQNSLGANMRGSKKLNLKILRPVQPEM
ncbi:MAG: hypothetical protein Kow0037_00660 [Calditrichia bacterium]